MRYASKRELLESIENEHRTLIELLATIPEQRYREGGVWGDGWTIDDLLAHLTEWEQMFLTWHRDGCAGRSPVMPAPGYKWGETPALNRAIQARHHSKSTAEIRRAFEQSYTEILALTTSLSEEALLAPGHFPWTKAYPLTTYLGANSASHYRFATKVLKRWLRSVA